MLKRSIVCLLTFVILMNRLFFPSIRANLLKQEAELDQFTEIRLTHLRVHQNRFSTLAYFSLQTTGTDTRNYECEKTHANM